MPSPSMVAIVQLALLQYIQWAIVLAEENSQKPLMGSRSINGHRVVKLIGRGRLCGSWAASEACCRCRFRC